MAGTDGQTPDNLIAQLEQRPFAFDFFRAVRLLQSAYPDRPRIGYSLSPAQDPVRFAQNPSLAFAPSTIEALRHAPPAEFPTLFVSTISGTTPSPPFSMSFITA